VASTKRALERRICDVVVGGLGGRRRRCGEHRGRAAKRGSTYSIMHWVPTHTVRGAIEVVVEPTRVDALEGAMAGLGAGVAGVGG